MGRPSWPVACVALGLMGCSSRSIGSTGELDPQGPDDAATPEAGRKPPAEGGSLHIDAAMPPEGLNGIDPGSSIALDAGTESSMPPRIGGDAAWPIAVPGGMPQVMSSGGPIVSNPVFQAVTFAGYDLTSTVDDFVARIGTTAYWHKAVGEYGIAAATAAPPVHLAEGAPANLDDVVIQQWLAAELTTGSGFVTPTPDTVYVLFYPSSTSITFNTEESCFTMGAYHSSTVVAGVNVAYAVVPECASQSKTAVQSTTSAASHEMIEAVTDPLPLTATPAYVGLDPAHLYLQLILGGGEVADMCAQWPTSFFVPDGLPYLVQRTWSNAAARDGLDPCQPELSGETYFNALPAMSDAVHILNGVVPQPTLGVSIAEGASKTIDVALYSEADVGPWNVTASNLPLGSTSLGFSWDKTSGNNGDTLHLTIRVNALGDNLAGDAFLIESTLDGFTNYAVGFVGQ